MRQLKTNTTQRTQSITQINNLDTNQLSQTLHKCVQWAGGEKISHLSNRKEKKNDPRQTYLHISAPGNLQYGSLGQEIITSIKKCGKTGTKNIMKDRYAAFYDMKS